TSGVRVAAFLDRTTAPFDVAGDPCPQATDATLFPAESKQLPASPGPQTLAERGSEHGIENGDESQSYQADRVMDGQPSRNRAERDAALAADGGLGVPLGRHPQVRLRQPGHRPLHEARDAAAGTHLPLP